MAQQSVPSVNVEAILAHTQDGVFVLDHRQRFVYFNPACQRLTGYSPMELVGSNRACGELLQCRDEHDRPVFGTLCPIRLVAGGEKPSGRQTVRITTKSGQSRWVETIFTALRLPGEQEVSIIGVMRDVGERQERELQYRQTIGELREEIERLHQQMRSEYGFTSVVSRSPGMQNVLDRIRTACGSNSPVLIMGERGTGKERIARTIHFNGLHKGGPFVPFVVAATRPDRVEVELFGYVRGGVSGTHEDYPGLVRAADGGTLFIDGLEHLTHTCQHRLLRLVEDQEVRPAGGLTAVPVQVRIIASVHGSVRDLAATGTLLDELVGRLGVLAIEVPPLRVRREDIPLLVQQFIHEFNQRGTRQVREVAGEVWEVLASHDWPGNTQELRNVIESAYAAGTSDTLLADEIHIPRRLAASTAMARLGRADVPALDEQMAEFERQSILEALRRAGGQRSLAARYMGISRSRLYRRMEALGIATRQNQAP